MHDTVLYSGIDEAGLGPLLGPLSAASASGNMEPESLTLSLQEFLPKGSALADSKKVYRGPKDFARLESLILPLFLLSEKQDFHSDLGLPALAIFSKEEKTAMAQLLWYQGLQDMILPLEENRSTIFIKTQRLRETNLAGADWSLRGKLYTEKDFNEKIEELDNKTMVLRNLLSSLLQDLQTRGEKGLQKRQQIVVDHLGGVKFYKNWLCEILPPERNWETIHEKPKSSSYHFEQGDYSLGIDFLVKGDQENIYCSLASCWAKYRREVLMRTLNQYWQLWGKKRGISLPYTSGYYKDATVFLKAIPEMEQDIQKKLRRSR